MGFTTSCFIRKNSKELQEKLADIGYKFTCLPSGDALVTENERSLAYIEKLSNVPYYAIEEDCGTNEDLFLAIAALRDDSVIYQWFTDGEKWVKSDIHNLIKLKEYFEEIGFDYHKTHKATVEELINHFK